MSRIARFGAVAGALAALALPAAALGQGGGGLLLTEAPDSGFPDKTFILELPTSRELAAVDLNVTENGAGVVGLGVESPGGSASGVILLIDASNSMVGAPIQAAVQAARAFLKERKDEMPVAIVAFNPEQTTLVGFTKDGQTLANAVAQAPALGEGTEIYDTLVEASEMARSEQLERTTVILLSDGTDIGSESSRADAVTALNAANVRVLSVGLSSPQYDAATLRSLAQRTGGTYVETAAPGELGAIFADLGRQLSKEFVVTYRSVMPPDVPVEVRVTMAGVASAATATYTSPHIDFTARGSFERSWLDDIITSPFLMVFVIVSILALLAFAALTALDVRNRSIRRRMAMYVNVPSEEESSLRRAEVANMLAAEAQRRVGGQRWWQSFERDVELGDFEQSALTLAGWTIIGGVVASVGAALVFQSLAGLLVGLLAPVVLKAVVSIKVSRKRAAFEQQLPDNIDVLAGALRAGHSLVGAMAVMVEGADEPSKTEYRRVMQDEQLGVPIDQALMVMAQRMVSRDTEQVALVTRLQREAGGNTAEVLDRVVDNMRARLEIKRLVRVLTAQGRMGQWILTGLPLALTGAILLLNPDYLDPLFNTTVGQAFLVLWVVMLVSGWYALKKIVEIEL